MKRTLTIEAFQAAILIDWMQRLGMYDLEIDKIQTRAPSSSGLKRLDYTAIRQQMKRLCDQGYFKACSISDDEFADSVWTINRAPH